MASKKARKNKPREEDMRWKPGIDKLIGVGEIKIRTSKVEEDGEVEVDVFGDLPSGSDKGFRWKKQKFILEVVLLN